MTTAGPRDHDRRHAKTTVDSCPLQAHAKSRQHEHAEVLEHRSLGHSGGQMPLERATGLPESAQIHLPFAKTRALARADAGTVK